MLAMPSGLLMDIHRVAPSANSQLKSSKPTNAPPLVSAHTVNMSFP